MQAFKERVRELRNLLRRRGRSPDDADDLIQTAFLRLHVYCQDEDVRHQQAFLTRAVLNLSIDLHRKEHRELFAAEPVESLALVDVSATPEDVLFARQRLMQAGAVLDALSPRTREIFLMHRVDGYSCAQIAQHFEISLSAVEKHIARAVLSLMDIVERS